MLEGFQGSRLLWLLVVVREKMGNGAEERSSTAEQVKAPGGLGRRFRWHILKLKQHPSRILDPSPWGYGQSAIIFGCCRMKAFSASMVLLFPDHIPSLSMTRH